MVGSRDRAMDIHTSEAIGTLRADLRRVEVALGATIDARVWALESALRGEMGELRGGPGLRDDIGMIAEGLAALDRKVESLHPPAEFHQRADSAHCPPFRPGCCLPSTAGSQVD